MNAPAASAADSRACTASPMPPSLRVQAIGGLPKIRPGDDLASIIVNGLITNGISPNWGDALVVAQKIVSKSEGRMVDLREVRPSDRAHEMAARAEKDPRLVEVILGESREVLRVRPGLIIVETHTGLVMANAGVDQSNVEQHDESEMVLLLPANPDASAAALRASLSKTLGIPFGIVIADSIGRAWREGTLGTAIGVAGFAPIKDYRGTKDFVGRTMQVSRSARADAIAAAASLVMGEGAEGYPVALASGLALEPATGSAQDLVRARAIDLFR